MHQWDIVRVKLQPKDRDLHPAVVISCEEDCQDPQMRRVNVLYGGKRAPAAVLEPWQVLLDEADNLDCKTALDCGISYLVDKAACVETVGQVSFERRRAIGRRIIEILRLVR